MPSSPRPSRSAGAACRARPAIGRGAAASPKPSVVSPADVPAARTTRRAAALEAELTAGTSSPRDLPTAIMTAATIVIVAFVCFTVGRTTTALLAAVIIGIASIEFGNALRTKGFRSATLLGVVASATLPLAVKHYGSGAYPIYFGLIVVVSMLWYLWEVTPGRPLLGIATTVLGFAYIGGLGGFAGLLLAERRRCGPHHRRRDLHHRV